MHKLLVQLCSDIIEESQPLSAFQSTFLIFFPLVNDNVKIFGTTKQAMKEAHDSRSCFSEEFKCQAYIIGNKHNAGSNISFHCSYGLGTLKICFIISGEAF